MSSTPRVSIIIPFLNEEKFIQKAIDSVLAQTYDRRELLLVDDGSTDASTEIALRNAERHPGKVRYLEHEGYQNRDACTSRNLLESDRFTRVFMLLCDPVALFAAAAQQNAPTAFGQAAT
jgi:glycosyltransferase involved in cell wall biosynthesis